MASNRDLVPVHADSAIFKYDVIQVAALTLDKPRSKQSLKVPAAEQRRPELPNDRPDGGAEQDFLAIDTPVEVRMQRRTRRARLVAPQAWVRVAHRSPVWRPAAGRRVRRRRQRCSCGRRPTRRVHSNWSSAQPASGSWRRCVHRAAGAAYARALAWGS
jgi:hypothetical protein